MDKFPTQYTAGVNKTERVKELTKRKADAKRGVFSSKPTKTDKVAVKKGLVKKSTFTQKFNSLYPDVKFDLTGFSKKFSIPYASLKEVYDKGLKAWATSGSRAGVPAQAWAKARVYKFILIQQKKLPEPKSDPDAYLRK